MYLGEDTSAATTTAPQLAPQPEESVKNYTRRVARKVITNGLLAAGISGIIFGSRKAALFGGLARLAYDYVIGL